MSELPFDIDPKRATPKDLEKRIIDSKERNITRIRERSPEDLRLNYDRTVGALEAYYISQSRVPVLRRLFGGVKELRKKADLFYQFYEKEAFQRIGHTASADLGARAILKSPERLERESTIKEKRGVHSGDLDREIGNTNYIFAGLDATPSRSYTPRSRRTYYIDPSAPGYAVPMDIADIKWPYYWTHDIYNNGYDFPHLQMYADNLFYIEDFKRIYALYNAVIFTAPQEAIDFNQAHRFDFMAAACWMSDTLVYDFDSGKSPFPPKEPDNSRMLQMREILQTYGIYPPVAPEFQYRDEVEGVRYEVKS